MNNILVIIKKEFARFFKDKRLVLSTIILPGLLIFLLYSIMGSAMGGIFSSDDEYKPRIYVANNSQILTLSDNDYFSVVNENFLIDEIKEKIANQEENVDLLVVFPENFDDAIVSGQVPNIEIYYNSVSSNSTSAYSLVEAVFTTYEQSISNIFDINKTVEGDLASKDDITGMFLSMMLPMLMMVFIFSGCIAVAPESIAGEKERGTITTMLVTPLKRSHLAIGKIIALSCISLLSGISSFIGTILSIPKLMDGVADDLISVSAYSFGDYALLLLTIFSTVLIMVALISLISAFAKNVKEAQTYVMPLMVVSMLVGLSSMFSSGGSSLLITYAIPLLSSVQVMNAILTFTLTIPNFIVMIVSNAIYISILVFILTKIFNSEKIMFNK